MFGMLLTPRHLTDREAVEKRLFVLQQQGFIYAYDTS